MRQLGYPEGPVISIAMNIMEKEYKHLKTVTHKELSEVLAKQGVKLLGGGLDEAPFAYKDIHEVMKAQSALVETVGVFHPKIVKMDGKPPAPR